MRGPALDSRDTPCHHCKDRYTACSDYCQKPEFLEWKQERQTIMSEKELEEKIAQLAPGRFAV
jgi:endogenous inhibitor of DNA gyrase (YacG/DUF329 family)